MLMVSSPKPWTPKFVGGGPTLLHLHSGLTAQSVTNDVRWTPTLSWSSHCRSNTTTTRAIISNYGFTLGQCPWRHCRSASGGETTPHHPYKPLGLLAGPLPHHQVTSCLSTKSRGQVDIFPLAAGVRNPQQLQTPITSMCGLGFSHPTTLLSSTFYVDADGHLICPIWSSIEEVVPV
jgi:hypothetical protein